MLAPELAVEILEPPRQPVVAVLELTETLVREGFEELRALVDPRSGARAFLAVHDTSAGPAFGGTRRAAYLDDELAIRDCLRLARAMTYKCALTGLPAGGAKLVLVDRPELDLAAAYRFLGDVVERCAGRVYTGPDVGTNERELTWLSERTRYATDPGPRGPGLLAEATCAGVVAGIRAALHHVDGVEDLSHRTVVVQGLGEVGARVAEELVRLGARVVAAETDPERAVAVARRTAIELVEPASEIDLPCDVFAPCALGGILHDLSVVRLRCRVVAGAANNVLAAPEHADQLHERGILYVPDFAINAGALIRGARFHLEGVREDVAAIGARIGAVVSSVLALAADQGLPPAAVAEREALARVAARRCRS